MIYFALLKKIVYFLDNVNRSLTFVEVNLKMKEEIL